MKKTLQSFCLIICIAVFCFSVWKLFVIWQEYHAGDEIYDSIEKQVAIKQTDSSPAEPGQSETPDRDDNIGVSVPDSLVNLEELKEINSHAIGWIMIPDTSINYPILQTANNNDYLRRTITGEDNKAGCIFADYRCADPFHSANTIVYGHNLLNGKMFSDLMNYEDENWYKEHPCIYIQTYDGVRVYEVYSCYRTADNSRTYTFGLKTETEFYENYLNQTLEQALYPTDITPLSSDQIITLSTCTTETAEQRFVVHARLFTR